MELMCDGLGVADDAKSAHAINICLYAIKPQEMIGCSSTKFKRCFSSVFPTEI